jgi:hypothetical protein
VTLPRRAVLLAVLAVAGARPAAASPIVATLGALAAALLAAVKWSADLVGALDAAWERGERLVDRADARRLKDDIQAIGAASADLKLGRGLLIDRTDSYLAAPGPALWEEIREDTQRLVARADALMAELQQKLGPRLGASEAYAAFLEHTGRRRELLARLAALPAPVTVQEREALSAVNEAQKALRARYGQVMAALERLAA